MYTVTGAGYSKGLPEALAPRVAEMYCPMRELRAYLLERGRPFPLPEGPALANEPPLIALPP